MARLLSGRFAPTVELNIDELADFEYKLKHLYGMTVKHRRRQMQKVTNFAMIPTKKKMKQFAPRGKTGSLKKSIATNKAVATGFGSFVGSRTGPIIRGKSKNRAFHAHLVELGTKRKVKKRKPGKQPFTFYSFRKRAVLRLDKINHGSRARPFIKPAIDRTKHEYPERIRVKMQRILNKLADDMNKS